MSGTFPSSPVPRDVAISSNQNTIVTTTASGRRQARQIDGQRFRLRITFPVMTRTEFAPILAFIMKQRSQIESFQYVPPTLDDALGVASGVISVNGAVNAGDAIYTDYGAEGGSFKAGMPITVGERGREIFVPQTNGNIIPNHDIGMGGMNITFNIQANDVRGIKELLIDNRATIINLVNQGANQKGKSNVV